MPGSPPQPTACPTLLLPPVTTPRLEAAFDEACLAYCHGRFLDAAASYAALVAQGHAASARSLADMYLRGEGVAASVPAGLSLLRQAAGAGDWLAAWNLAAHLRSGADNVPVDLEDSRRCFRLARELGCPYSIDEYL